MLNRNEGFEGLMNFGRSTGKEEVFPIQDIAAVDKVKAEKPLRC